MTTEIRMPAVSANEDEILLAQWHRDSGDAVRKGDMICSVETTKATVEVEAEADGFLQCRVEAGTKVATGTVIGTIAETAEAPAPEPTPAPAKKPAAKRAAAPKAGKRPRPAAKASGEAPPTPGRKWTRKAEIVARRAGIEIEEIYQRLGGRTLTEADVRAAVEGGDATPAKPVPAKPAPAPVTAAPKAAPAAPARPASPVRGRDLLDDACPEGRPERILLLGGGAGAGAMTVDILSGSRRQRVVGILDNNPDVHGSTVGGAPILGPCDMAEQIWRDGVCDSVILLITKDLYERAEIFGKLSARGVPFANVVDPTTEIKGGVSMGTGNLIMGRCYLATGVTLGDNNFLASQTCIEHHSTVGSHCTFGPRTTTSGAVTVGDRVKTGMGVNVEPYLTIGADSLIASGCTITADIPARSAVKAQTAHVVRPRDAA